MKIRKLQEKIVAGLNGVEALVQHSCKAFAEDALTVQNAIGNAVTGAGDVAVVVVSPHVVRDGDGIEEGIPVEIRIVIRFIESPALRSRRGDFSALDAAEAAILALDGHQLAFVTLDQSADIRTGTVTASAEFATSVILTDKEQ